MDLPLLRTPVDIATPEVALSYRSPVVLMGSCFAEEMGLRLRRFCFLCEENPFGVLYNPASIGTGLERLLQSQPFAEKDLEYDGERWFSFAHHGRLSHRDRASCLEMINQRLDTAAKRLRRASHLLLTFGTAWVYERVDSGTVVANCHRQPAERFARRLLSVEEIVESYTLLLQQLHATAPQLHVVFSISPVRHWRDSASGNQRSKATLILAVHRLVEGAGVDYFPAYEIVMDELRDYRYYADDMLHVARAGAEYVWERFATTWIDEESRAAMAQVGRVRASLEHRPRDTESQAHADLLTQLAGQLAELQRQHPGVELGDLRAELEKRQGESGC